VTFAIAGKKCLQQHPVGGVVFRNQAFHRVISPDLCPFGILAMFTARARTCCGSDAYIPMAADVNGVITIDMAVLLLSFLSALWAPCSTLLADSRPTSGTPAECHREIGR
jgi:hypothetical protein